MSDFLTSIIEPGSENEYGAENDFVSNILSVGGEEFGKSNFENENQFLNNFGSLENGNNNTDNTNDEVANTKSKKHAEEEKPMRKSSRGVKPVDYNPPPQDLYNYEPPAPKRRRSTGGISKAKGNKKVRNSLGSTPVKRTPKIDRKGDLSGFSEQALLQNQICLGRCGTYATFGHP
eukprot:Pgem_evm1s7473